jgi:hypothetical protein
VAERSRREIAAAGVRFPAATIVAGVSGKPTIGGWGGETEAPRSITLAYEPEGVSVTSYCEPMWGGGLSGIWPDLRTFVESSYANHRRARDSPPLDFSDKEPYETTFTRTAKGYTEFSVYEGPPEEEVRRNRKVWTDKAEEAEHREVELPLGSTRVEATVVGEPDLWAAGFSTPCDGGLLVALISGGRVEVDALALEAADDLVAVCFS